MQVLSGPFIHSHALPEVYLAKLDIKLALKKISILLQYKLTNDKVGTPPQLLHLMCWSFLDSLWKGGVRFIS